MLKPILIQGAEETEINYFKNILPNKKEKLAKLYEEIVLYIKKAKKGLKSNNVEEVRWWFGYLFTIICENKENIDPIIYESVISLKNEVYNSIHTMLFFHHAFKNIKTLTEEFNKLINIIDTRISELKLYVQLAEKI